MMEEDYSSFVMEWLSSRIRLREEIAFDCHSKKKRRKSESENFESAERRTIIISWEGMM